MIVDSSYFSSSLFPVDLSSSSFRVNYVYSFKKWRIRRLIFTSWFVYSIILTLLLHRCLGASIVYFEIETGFQFVYWLYYCASFSRQVRLRGGLLLDHLNWNILTKMLMIYDNWVKSIIEAKKLLEKNVKSTIETKKVLQKDTELKKFIFDCFKGVSSG